MPLTKPLLAAALLFASLATASAKCNDPTDLSAPVSLTTSGYPAFQFQVTCQSAQFPKFQVFVQKRKGAKLKPFQHKEGYLRPEGFLFMDRNWHVIVMREKAAFSMEVIKKGNKKGKFVRIPRTN